MCKSISGFSSLHCTLFPGTDCTLYDGMSPLSPPHRQKKLKKEKIRINKIVHYIPDSVVQYEPESVVH